MKRRSPDIALIRFTTRLCRALHRCLERLVVSHLPGPLLSGNSAPDSVLDTLDGGKIHLSTYWQAQPILLLFVRHLGCVFCRQQLSLLRRQYDVIREKGADVVVIVPVDVPSTRSYAASLSLPFPTLADPQRSSYIDYDLADAAPLDLIDPAVLMRTVSQFARGNIPVVNPFSSPLRQLGGVFIIDTAGSIRFTHTVKPVFKYPPLETYFSVFDSLRLAHEVSA